jgi:N-acetylneuraminic acid mutarotase
MGEVFYRYNPSTNTWVKLPAPPADHALGGGAAIGGKFYLNGGFTSSCGGTCGGNTHNLDVYNPATNTWTTKPGRGSTATTAGALNGKLYILGGFGDTYNRTVDAYDPITNTWTSRAPLPEGSALGMAVGATGKLYYIEGETSWFAERPSMVYAYTP